MFIIDIASTDRKVSAAGQPSRVSTPQVVRRSSLDGGSCTFTLPADVGSASFEKELHAALLQRNGASGCPAAGFILPLKEGERNDGRLEEGDETSVLIMAGQSRALLLLQVFHLGSGPEMSVVCCSHVGYVRLHAYR